MCSDEEVWTAMHQEPHSHPSGTIDQAARSQAAILRRDTPSPVAFTTSQGASGSAAARQQRLAGAAIPEQEVNASFSGCQTSACKWFRRMQGVPAEPGCRDLLPVHVLFPV